MSNNNKNKPDFLKTKNVCSSKDTEKNMGNSLAVQWLGFRTLTAEGPGSIPGQGTKTPQPTWPKKTKNQKNREIEILKKKKKNMKRQPTE